MGKFVRTLCVRETNFLFPQIQIHIKLDTSQKVSFLCVFKSQNFLEETSNKVCECTLVIVCVVTTPADSLERKKEENTKIRVEP